MRLFPALGLGLAFLASPSFAADQKGPPSCSAIDFRPVAQGMPDGEQDAGLYKSRFGRIEMKATVKGGQAADYTVVVNNRPLKALATLPQAVIECAASKKIPATVRSVDSCAAATKLRVIIAQSGADKMIATYGLKGKGWSFCRAGTAV
ncbi:MAG: hypothetical protein EXQ95_05905 [Alphaproteobacteria bacterium]|nr:hypothetical protein [Alphaproteobacteria bacterium]